MAKHPPLNPDDVFRAFERLRARLSPEQSVSIEVFGDGVGEVKLVNRRDVLASRVFDRLGDVEGAIQGVMEEAAGKYGTGTHR